MTMLLSKRWDIGHEKNSTPCSKTVRVVDKCVLVCLLSDLAAPYSPIATVNIYAVFCSRWVYLVR